jgi:hypothetical protein
VNHLGSAVVMVGEQVLARDRLAVAAGRSQAQHPERDQHHGHHQLQAGFETGGDAEPESDDDGAGHAERQHVTEAPEGADQGAVGEPALPAHDRRDRHQVVGVRRVLQAQHEPEPDGAREQVHGGGYSDILRSRPVCRARSTAARNAQWASTA